MLVVVVLRVIAPAGAASAETMRSVSAARDRARCPGGATANGADVAVVSPGDVKVSVRTPVSPVTIRPTNVATPPTAFAVAGPLSVPPPVAIAAVTIAVD